MKGVLETKKTSVLTKKGGGSGVFIEPSKLFFSNGLNQRSHEIFTASPPPFMEMAMELENEHDC
jgi:hypothetical protein